MALFKFFVAALAATAVVSASHINVAREDSYTLNPVGITTFPLEATINARGLTNAKRMAMGLPLMKPHRRDGSLRARTSATPTSPEVIPTPEPNPGCKNRSGVIRVHSGDTDEYDGFVNSQTNQFGEIGYTPDINQALKVTLKSCDGSPFAIVASNGPAPDLPFVGGISGFANSGDDFKSGSFNYAFLGFSTETARNGPPSGVENSFTRTTKLARNAQSTIWSVDDDDNITAQWVNTDSFKPATTILYVPREKTFVFAGDVTTFRNTFGPSPESTFTFEEL